MALQQRKQNIDNSAEAPKGLFFISCNSPQKDAESPRDARAAARNRKKELDRRLKMDRKDRLAEYRSNPQPRRSQWAKQKEQANRLAKRRARAPDPPPATEKMFELVFCQKDVVDHPADHSFLMNSLKMLCVFLF